MVNYIHEKCNNAAASPCKDGDVKRWIQTQKQNRASGKHQAPTIDYAEAFPSLYNAVWGTFDGTSYTHYVQEWAIILFFIWFAARPVEVSEYCPYFEDVSLPTDSEAYDPDGLPKYIEIGFRDWKHRKPRSVQRGPFKMIVYRNYLGSKYCLLFWLLQLFRSGHIQKGPIFRPLQPNGHFGDCVRKKVDTDKGYQYVYYKTANPQSHRATFSSDTISTLLSAVFQKAGYPQCTGYTFRRSSVKWWRICGAQEWEIKNGGRWSSAWMHAGYLEEGMLDPLRQDDDSHPIRKLWVWRPNTLHKALAPEFAHQDK